MTTRMVLWGAAVAAVSVLAFVLLDPVVAAFVAILLVTGALVAVLARDWDRHSTYEERNWRAPQAGAEWERGTGRPRPRPAEWEAAPGAAGRQDRAVIRSTPARLLSYRLRDAGTRCAHLPRRAYPAAAAAPCPVRARSSSSRPLPGGPRLALPRSRPSRR